MLKLCKTSWTWQESHQEQPSWISLQFFRQKEPGLLDDLFVERPEVKSVLDSGSNRRGWTWRINLGYSYTVPGISLWSLSSGPSLIWRSLRTSFFTGTGQDSTWVTDMIWSCLYNFANCTKAKCGHRVIDDISLIVFSAVQVHCGSLHEGKVQDLAWHEIRCGLTIRLDEAKLLLISVYNPLKAFLPDHAHNVVDLRQVSFLYHKMSYSCIGPCQVFPSTSHPNSSVTEEFHRIPTLPLC